MCLYVGGTRLEVKRTCVWRLGEHVWRLGARVWRLGELVWRLREHVSGGWGNLSEG